MSFNLKQIIEAKAEIAFEDWFQSPDDGLSSYESGFLEAMRQARPLFEALEWYAQDAQVANHVAKEALEQFVVGGK